MSKVSVDRELPEGVAIKIECATCRGTGSLEFERGAVVKDCAPCKGTGRDLKAERYALAARLAETIAALSAVTAERDRLRELSVERILLDVVPGDGEGHEVYAKSVEEVEAALTAEAERAEALEAERDQLRAEVEALTRLAQTEQQPVRWRRVVERLIANVEILDQRPRPMCRDCADCNGVCDSGLDCDIPALVEEARAMLAAPIAQTEQQPSTDALINGAKALLALDESGSLAPHGIGGLAREVIEKLIVRVEQTAPQPED